MRATAVAVAIMAGAIAACAQQAESQRTKPHPQDGVYAGRLSWQPLANPDPSAARVADVTIEIDRKSTCAVAAWTLDGVRRTIAFDERACPAAETNWFCIHGNRVDEEAEEVVPSGVICGRRVSDRYESIEAVIEHDDIQDDAFTLEFTLTSPAGEGLYRVSVAARRGKR
jgi:hypothetical protein